MSRVGALVVVRPGKTLSFHVYSTLFCSFLTPLLRLWPFRPPLPHRVLLHRQPQSQNVCGAAAGRGERRRGRENGECVCHRVCCCVDQPTPPPQVLARPDLLRSAVTDLVLLHGLGVRLAVALGTGPQVDARLAARGAPSRFVGGYRVTDAAALDAAVDAAGAARVVVEAAMSKVVCVRERREFVLFFSCLHAHPTLPSHPGPCRLHDPPPRARLPRRRVSL